ncbi:MAG: 16S rRNA processing protein RimM [Lachnospiraceae bacterium]|nr:16S rRNA processing protein RimM [Lachnospiraceae bacterium]
MEDFLRVGVITTTHGIKGEVKVFPTTEDPARFRELKEIWVQTAKGKEKKRIEQVRYFKQFVILKLEGISDIDRALLYKSCDLFVDREHAIPLEEDEYYISDIIGLEVISDEDEKLGVVKDVIQTGANDVYEVLRENGKTVLLPAIRSCILGVDVAKGEMRVHLMEGLLDE